VNRGANADDRFPNLAVVQVTALRHDRFVDRALVQP
jgi:hypothetical protein